MTTYAIKTYGDKITKTTTYGDYVNNTTNITKLKPSISSNI